MNCIWSCAIDREQRFSVFSSFVQIDKWKTLTQVNLKLKLIIKQSFQCQRYKRQAKVLQLARDSHHNQI